MIAVFIIVVVVVYYAIGTDYTDKTTLKIMYNI